MKNKDTIFAESLPKISEFTFDENVADVFPDMISRSVPGYEYIIQMTSFLTAQFSQPNTNFYDLGCSLGASTLAMQAGNDKPNCKIIAVDNSSAMLENFEQFINNEKSNTPVELICDDINNINIQNASLVVLNFTLQFVEPEKRIQLLQKIYDGLVPNGALVLSEKIAFPEKEQQLQTDLHLNFKRAHGYSELEISQKRSALENVLIPETFDEHHKRLQKIGYTTTTWFQCLNFASILGIKK